MDKVWTLFFVFPLSLTIVNMSVVVQFYFHVSWKSGLVSCDLVSLQYGIHVIKCEILSRYISLFLSLPTFFIHFLNFLIIVFSNGTGWSCPHVCLPIVNMSVVVPFYFHVPWKSGLVPCDLVSQQYGIHVIKCEILSRYISLFLSFPTPLFISFPTVPGDLVLMFSLSLWEHSA
jgi:hypothetical protein